MSQINATYSFLPWLRQGVANNIKEADGDPNVKLRASIPIEVIVSGLKVDNSPLAEEKVLQQISLYGPADVIGVESKAIVKNEPRNWITNFEPNYLPYIDFYEEDFPWRYSPMASNGQRLKPWLTLVVLKEEEFEDVKNIKDRPLPGFILKGSASAVDIFPKADELWAWAHVHVNKDLADAAVLHAFDLQKIHDNLSNIIQKTPDMAYSRIISPRKLSGNSAYHAFLIPSFEGGRLAGLGMDIDPNLMASKSSWDGANNKEFPYYHRWFFRTGEVGDFEYLVNLLKPKLADKTIGYRDMDVLHPGVNLTPINNPELQGILKLGGALRVPMDTLKPADKLEVLKYDNWDENPYPHQFTIEIAKRINLADDYMTSGKTVESINQEVNILDSQGEADPDPVITSPLYGRWHALQQRLLKNKNDQNLPHSKNWIHELNLDPRFRVAAGFGTQVIQKNQELYMHAAWEQIGKVVELNNKIKWSQLAIAVSANVYKNQLVPLKLNSSFLLTSPLHSRIKEDDLTVKAKVSESVVPLAMTSGVFRSIIRPRGKLMKNLIFTDKITAFNLLERVNEGEVIVVAPKTDPSGAITESDFNSGNVAADTVPNWYKDLRSQYPKIRLFPLYLLLFIILLFILYPLFATSSILSILAVVGILGFIYFRKWENILNQKQVIVKTDQTAETVDSYPKRPDFTLSMPGLSFAPSEGNVDSVEAEKFKLALKDSCNLINYRLQEPVKHKLDLVTINTKIIHKINPVLTIPKRSFSMIHIPIHIKENMLEQFSPVMAYPEFDIPMYKPLADISTELFLPNINKIEENSITLLENNQKFIEAYMVGINHEMSRELLWREYLTDQRGSYFRQFWDVSGYLPIKPVPEDIKEKLRDIPAIHTWSRVNTSRVNPADPTSVRKNELGSHNQRALQSGKTQLVLVIRGELLKKYPTAVIYAQKAAWGKDKDVISVKAERVLAELTDSERANPPLEKVKTPLFEAKIDPDIYFFGFDLDDEEARGTLNPTAVTDDPGWFFILKERPGEPRFGLDIDKSRLINWNNLSWKDVETVEGQCIQLNKTINLQAYNSGIDQENKPIDEDTQVHWNPATDAAQLAYILYQVPVMVAVHASRMLPK